MKIRSYLALMVAAVLVPVIAFSAIALEMMFKSEREAALQRVRDTARIALVSIDRELANTQSALRMLAVSAHLAKGEFAQFYDNARYADQIGATVTALLDETGQLVLTTSVPYGAPLPPATAGERVARVIESGQAQVSNLVTSALSQRLLVVVDVPVSTRAGKRYVLSQGYDINYFKRVLRQVNIPPGWLAGVYDRDGQPIARTGSNGEGDGDGQAQAGAAARHPVLRDAIRHQTVGVIRNKSDSGIRLYSVLERSAMSGWTVAVGAPEAEIDAVARRALGLYLFGLLAAIACAGGAAWLFARRISQSIRAAARSALALERGDLPGPAIASGVAEVDAVQAAIVSAGAVINREQAQRQAVEDERARLYASEHAARTMAEQQNRAKDEFLAMLGHELRNPLAAIVNATRVLEHQATGAPAAARASDIIARQSGHLARIVDDLLDVGRVHSGKILLARQPVRLDAVAAAYAAHIASGRGARHRISATPVAAPVWIDADPTRIEQIIANLVDNAIKYTPAGGAITISVEASDDGTEAVLAVADNGMGIDAGLMPNVFELFVQGATALDRAQGGLGVGLALVRQLAVMHGGRVSVQSAGAGQGSRFEMRLPRIEAPVASAGASASSVAAAGAAPDSAAAGSVLLIEDNDDGREMMAMMLKSQGWTVHAAAHGAAGLSLAASERPPIALIDIGLPGIDGYEVARRLRADPATAAMRLVALTGYGQESDRSRALAAGFDNHLVKPVELRLLMAELDQAGAAHAAG